MQGNMHITGVAAWPLMIMFLMGLAISMAGGAWLTCLMLDHATDRVVRFFGLGRAIIEFVIAKHHWKGRSPVDIIRELQAEIDELREKLEAAEACEGDDDAALSESHALWVYVKDALRAVMTVTENHLPTRGLLYTYEIEALDRANAILKPEKKD